MESKRQQKFARLLQKELAEVFQRDVPHLFNGAYISISTVRTSPDLGVVKVYLSLLLAKEPKEVIATVRENTKAIRHALAQRIKNQVRVIPELNFFLDDSAEYAAKMDKIISDLDIPAAPAEDENNDGIPDNDFTRAESDEDEEEI
ncbi:30S ribosome-binding factor RbfA [Adhaeribacter sp. BT258]|uniref:Ribosome-binding factor A n=1 Tax=Adhaeribacter terrigena TaxID=2793070 RepID=A0ABS1C4B7_9BACT|nr:30S ribosome-binding factor RbfA [Adhaeribacter terrigena]MBK0404239.1 30S ribosome-binding factor RbfA [Adhaeribacter terrigena]